MTTATPDVSAATWPTEAELRAAARKLAKAANAVDELHLTAYRFNVDEDAPIPTLAELGMVSAFIEWTEMDLESIGTHLRELRAAHHKAATLIGA